MKSFAGKVAVVTGGGSGIGRELVLQLAAEGARVAAVDRNGTTADETVALAATARGTAKAFATDVADSAAVDTLAAIVADSFRPADILINAAGIIVRSRRFDAVPREDLERILDVNLWGAVHCSQAFLPQLLSRPDASLVNVSSIGGLAGLMEQVPYAISKYAIRGLSESLRLDLYGTGVKVTTVYPGPVKTNIVQNAAGYSAEEKTALVRRGEKIRQTSADSAARAILAGVRRGRSRVLIGPEAVALDLLTRLLPGGYAGLIHRPMRKMMDTAAGAGS